MAREALEPGREVDVGRAGHLGLQPDQALAGPEVVERLTIREYLAGERRPVELTQGMDAIRRGHSLSLCASVGRTDVDAMLPGQGPANW